MGWNLHYCGRVSPGEPFCFPHARNRNPQVTLRLARPPLTKPRRLAAVAVLVSKKGRS